MYPKRRLVSASELAIEDILCDFKLQCLFAALTVFSVHDKTIGKLIELSP